MLHSAFAMKKRVVGNTSFDVLILRTGDFDTLIYFFDIVNYTICFLELLKIPWISYQTDLLKVSGLFVQKAGNLFSGADTGSDNGLLVCRVIGRSLWFLSEYHGLTMLFKKSTDSSCLFLVMLLPTSYNFTTKSGYLHFFVRYPRGPLPLHPGLYRDLTSFFALFDLDLLRDILYQFFSVTDDTDKFV